MSQHIVRKSSFLHTERRGYVALGFVPSQPRAGSCTGDPNAIPLCQHIQPSKIQETAISVMRHVRFANDECSDDNYLLPSGSVGRLRTSTDDGSCRGTLDTRSIRPSLQPKPCVQRSQLSARAFPASAS